jgi:hydrogenase expression/formation protein HypE
MPENIIEPGVTADGGPSVLITKYIALEGTGLLAHAYEKELSEYFHPDIVKRAKCFEGYQDADAEKKIVLQTAPAYTYELKEGGLLSALWDISEAEKCGMDIDLASVPIKQETVEICEYFALNPYELLSGGSLLIITHEERKVLNALKRAGIKTAYIGNLNRGNDRLLRHGKVTSFLNRPAPDSLKEILKRSR